ncbi:LAME_0F16798g1_1 [Lachancea meyersii CBS 8951]|uniref:LAME_0F16798g1_1 n=1 Tax=Lachancea meyersii CBS 8951 TaxID=1266667 RepID=A0A1G4JZG4_9SACH|nr:LAME_0F16798g1_1 [Lachancea meyersii CBS 8951]
MRSVKCVVVGDGAVGKTSLLISYTTNTFPQDYIPTVFDNYTTTIALNDGKSMEHQVYRLNLWDTAGQEEYDRLRPLSYPQTDIFLLCFSVNEPNSFENVRDKWFPEIRHNTNYENMELFRSCGKYPILLVGTKADLRDDEHEQDRLTEVNSDFVSRSEIEQCVAQCGLMGYVECSAATQVGVAEVFERAVQCVVVEPDRLINQAKAASGPSHDRQVGGPAGSHDFAGAGVGDLGSNSTWKNTSSGLPKKRKKKNSKCSIL